MRRMRRTLTRLEAPGVFPSIFQSVSSVIPFVEESNDLSAGDLGPASVLPPSSGAPSTGQPSAKKTKSAKNHKIDTQSVKGEHNPGRRFRLVELGRGRVGRQRGDINVSEGSPKGTRDNPVEFQVGTCRNLES